MRVDLAATVIEHLEARAESAEHERDRARDTLRRADEELLLIADEAPEDIGERVDSVRALLKDPL